LNLRSVVCVVVIDDKALAVNMVDERCKWALEHSTSTAWRVPLLHCLITTKPQLDGCAVVIAVTIDYDAILWVRNHSQIAIRGALEALAAAVNAPHRALPHLDLLPILEFVVND